MLFHATELPRQLHRDRHGRLRAEFAPSRQRRRPPTRPTLTLVVTVANNPRRDAA
ncbi:MAG: hypothetical protein ACR2HP_05850 [Ilumatobacteraceae bacterium]